MPVISVALAFWGAATGPMYPADFQPSTAGSRHRFPVRFDFAVHRGAAEPFAWG
jgi:hypothetical protein